MHIIDGDNKDFASRLLDERKRLNKTQEQVATYCGISSRNISLYESGHSIPRPSTLDKLAEFLETDPYFLVHGCHKETAEDFKNSRKNFYKRLDARKSINYLYISDWERFKLDRNFKVIKYCENPSRDSQSNDLSKFIPYFSTQLNYFAVRLPKYLNIGNYDFNNSKESEQIIIINTVIEQDKDLETGKYVLYAPIDKNLPFSLGIIKKEIGEETFFIESIPNGFKLLEFDPNEYEILGQIETFITKQA